MTNRILRPCGEEMHPEPKYEGAFFCLWCGTLQFFIAQDLKRVQESGNPFGVESIGKWWGPNSPTTPPQEDPNAS